MLEIISITGWVGALLILTAFTTNVFKYTMPDSKVFLLLNGVGSLLLIYNSYATENYHFTLLNIVWFVVAIVGLIKRSKNISTTQ